MERIVVAGGDGTVSEVVTGLMASGLAGQVELGVLPLGTGGDFARGLGIPRDPEAAARQLADAKPRPIDAGRVRYVGRDGAVTESFFVNTTTYGISGLVVDLVEQATAKVPGTLAFLVGTLRALARYRVQPVRIAVDGQAPVVDMLKQLRAEWLSLREYEHVPLVKIKQASDFAGAAPLFDSLVVFENQRFDTALAASRPEWKQRGLQSPR